MGPPQQLIEQFEKGLVPNNLDASEVKARVLGYGEISTVFEIAGMENWACKRMPLFDDRKAAEEYQLNYDQYCQYLRDAGLSLAESQTQIVELEGKPTTLFIIQEKLEEDKFVNKLIHTETESSTLETIRHIIFEILKVRDFNKKNIPHLELALDGQLSNWAKEGDRIVYIDTSTPLYKVEGKEQLNPELFLKSAPSFLRWFIRMFFLKGVMNRYYDFRMILLDLVANLYKEQKEDLIPTVLQIINKVADDDFPTIQIKEVDAYYREDKVVWSLFLAFRRIDRWIKTRLLRHKYEHILPGKIIR